MDEVKGTYLESVVKDPDVPADSTRLEVRAYDLLGWAADRDTPPLAVGEVGPQGGVFRLTDVRVPDSGVIILVVDDVADATRDDFVPVGIPLLFVPNENAFGLHAVTVTREQEARWSEWIGGDGILEAMGCTNASGNGLRTLASCGTWIGVFTDWPLSSEGQWEPFWLEGVVPFDPGRPALPERTFYPGIDTDGRLVFDSTEMGVTWSEADGPHEWTGVLGTVFEPMASYGEVAVACAEDTRCGNAGCVFNEMTRVAVPEAIVVQIVIPIHCAELSPP